MDKFLPSEHRFVCLDPASNFFSRSKGERLVSSWGVIYLDPDYAMVYLHMPVPMFVESDMANQPGHAHACAVPPPCSTICTRTETGQLNPVQVLHLTWVY